MASAVTAELSMGPFYVTQPNPWVNPTHGQLWVTNLRLPSQPQRIIAA